MKKIESENVINLSGKAIHYGVRVLAVMMALVILWGIVDVGLTIGKKVMSQPYGLLTIADILDLFSAFLAVLIAIEIFQNITVYLEDEFIHVKIVIATALMAIARKIIVLEFKETEPAYVYASATVILALGATYWLVSMKMIKAKQKNKEE